MLTRLAKNSTGSEIAKTVTELGPDAVRRLGRHLDLNQIRKLDKESVAEFHKIFERTRRVLESPLRRGLDRFLPAHIVGAASELRMLVKLLKRPDVTEVRLVRPVNVKGDRRPDALARVKNGDGETIELHESTALTGARQERKKTFAVDSKGTVTPKQRRAYLARGAPRARHSTVDEIVRAVNGKVASGEKRLSQLEWDKLPAGWRDVPKGGVLHLYVRGGDVARRRVDKAMRALRNELPEFVKSVEFHTQGGKTQQLANPAFKPR